MLNVPTFAPQSSRWIEEVALDGVSFRLRFWFSARELAWYMDIFDTNDVSISGGIKLVPSIFLLNHYRSVAGIPGGDFLLLDNNQDDSTATVGFADLGARYQLVYYTAADIAALKAEAS